MRKLAYFLLLNLLAVPVCGDTPPTPDDDDYCPPPEVTVTAPVTVNVPCCKEKHQLVGFSERTVRGGDGLLAMTLACRESIEESRICTSEEVALTTAPPTIDRDSFAWVRPTAIVGRGANSGFETLIGIQGNVEDISCNGWSRSMSGGSGPSGLSVSPSGQFRLSPCGLLPVACCSIVKEQEPVLKKETIKKIEVKD